MTKAGALVPNKPLEVAETIACADDLLRIWEIDLEAALPETLRPLRDAAAAAIASGQAVRVGLALVTAAAGGWTAETMLDLLGSFPNKEADLRTFSRNLAQDVLALQASPAAVTAACAALRRDCTFRPSIAEILAAVEAQKIAFAARSTLLARLRRRVAEIDRILTIRTGLA